MTLTVLWEHFRIKKHLPEAPSCCDYVTFLKAIKAHKYIGKTHVFLTSSAWVLKPLSIDMRRGQNLFLRRKSDLQASYSYPTQQWYGNNITLLFTTSNRSISLFFVCVWGLSSFSTPQTLPFRFYWTHLLLGYFLNHWIKQINSVVQHCFTGYYMKVHKTDWEVWGSPSSSHHNCTFHNNQNSHYSPINAKPFQPEKRNTCWASY